MFQPSSGRIFEASVKLELRGWFWNDKTETKHKKETDEK